VPVKSLQEVSEFVLLVGHYFSLNGIAVFDTRLEQERIGGIGVAVYH
jgi:hypothetical protein